MTGLFLTVNGIPLMSKNEKYIAFTRALSELVEVIDTDQEL